MYHSFRLEGELLINILTVIQELGREGVIPFSSFFASNKPFNAPFPGLFGLWVLSTTLILAVPPGDAYVFFLNRESLLPSVIAVTDRAYFFVQSTMTSNSCVLSYINDQRGRHNRIIAALHSGIQSLELGPAFPCTSTRNRVLPTLQPLSRGRSVVSTFSG